MATSKPRIALCYPVERRHIDQIVDASGGAEVVDAGQERIAQELPTANVFCGHAKTPVPWDEVVAGGKLQWIQSSAAGLDHCLVPSVIDSPIVVTSASGVFADQVAEQTLALLLGLLRGLPVFFRAQEKREFIRRPTRDLHRSTVGIVGLGGNGRRLAEVLAAFKTRIVATDFFAEDRPPEVETLLPADRLHDLLRQSDIVILCTPLNSQTEGLIDRAAFGQMKRGAIFINVARGPCVVESELVAALQSGHLAGAGVDVTLVEPLPVESPLWAMPNVIVTPHVGAQSARRYDDVTDFFCENLRRRAAGLPLWNEVDKRLGFPSPERRRPKAL
jgi:phosphoglycerate dehydrogenase-like enzyme